MKNRILILLATCALFSCQDEYTSYLKPEGLDKISVITLSPNSPTLIADGRHELTFKIKAFMHTEHTRKIERIVNGESVISDSVFVTRGEVRADRLNPDDFTITASTGETVSGLTYTTTQTGNVTFTATYKGVTSTPQTVEMVAADTRVYEERVIPVIFHLCIQPENAAEYAGYDEAFFRKLLDRTNAVFAGTAAPDPLATDSKIRFVLATHNPNGLPFATPGVERITLPAGLAGIPLTNWMRTSANVGNTIWDPSRYLNIWCLSAGATAQAPLYLKTGSDPIPGLNILPARVVADDAAALTIAKTVSATGIYSGGTLSTLGLGLMISPRTYLRMDDRTNVAMNLANTFGAFFGLTATAAPDDYCADTFQDAEYGNAEDLERSVSQGTKPTDPEALANFYTVDFDAYNAMTAVGRRTSFTPDQIARMRLVMDNSPLRMMKQ